MTVRTDLTHLDVVRKQARLADMLQAAVPASVRTVSPHTLTVEDLDDLLARGMDALVEKGYAWPEDVAVFEDGGRLPSADPALLTHAAKARGKNQLDTIGSGNNHL